MFMDSFERTEFSDAVYGILGRALTYCCRFESICRSVAALRQIKLNPQVFKSKVDSEKFMRQIYSQSLNKTISSFSSKYKIFENAREARNKIIHETSIGFDCCLDQLPDNIVKNTIEDIKPLIAAITEADYMLTYLTLLETREPLPTFKSEAYTRKVMNWVFETEESI